MNPSSIITLPSSFPRSLQPPSIPDAELRADHPRFGGRAGKCLTGTLTWPGLRRKWRSKLLAVGAALATFGTLAAVEIVDLPDGTAFPFWDDRTDYRATYHVACQNPQASDTNPGTSEKPWRTINRAAEMLQPGEKVIVHGGVYRECVSPQRGGTSSQAMIAYEAAKGEQVVVTGAVPWVPRCQPSSGWEPALKTAWMADFPAEMFVGYNPFLARNFYEEFLTCRNKEDFAKYMLRRGHVFVEGKPLQQVARYADLAQRDGAFWVEEPGLRIHFRLAGDADPRQAAIEITVQEQVFAPRQRGLGYIRVSGFHFERAADGVPVPQRAMVSTNRGHHWILEKNEVRWANACGIEVGNQDWKAAKPAEFGHHIVRGNLVSDCGVCGIGGCAYVDYTLVENNLVQRVGGMAIERMWEVAGLKFHLAHNVLIRHNTFRDLHRAAGVWLDCMNANCRVTGNLFQDISSCNGVLFVEVSHAPNILDHNVFWNINPSPGKEPVDVRDGSAVCVDSSTDTIVAHNFFGNVRGFAACVNNIQADRLVDGRLGECRGNAVLNNIFFASPRRIYLGRGEGNLCDGNVFDAGDKDGLFDIQDSPPEPKLRLDAWQAKIGQDRRSVAVPMEAALGAADGQLRFSCGKIAGLCVPVARLGESAPATGPGPFNAEQWKLLREGQSISTHQP